MVGEPSAQKSGILAFLSGQKKVPTLSECGFERFSQIGGGRLFKTDHFCPSQADEGSPTIVMGPLQRRPSAIGSTAVLLPQGNRIAERARRSHLPSLHIALLGPPSIHIS